MEVRGDMVLTVLVTLESLELFAETKMNSTV